MNTPETLDGAVLAAIMKSRVETAKKTVEEVIDEAIEEHEACLRWFDSDATTKGSLRWFCEILDLEPDAVRRAVRETS